MSEQSNDWVHRGTSLGVPFTQIPNELLQNEELSPEAIGTLCELLSRPPGWKVVKSQLIRKNRGDKKLRRILQELMDQGYVFYMKSRDSENRFSGIHWVYMNCAQNEQGMRMEMERIQKILGDGVKLEPSFLAQNPTSPKQACGENSPSFLAQNPTSLFPPGGNALLQIKIYKERLYEVNSLMQFEPKIETPYEEIPSIVGEVGSHWNLLAEVVKEFPGKRWKRVRKINQDLVEKILFAHAYVGGDDESLLSAISNYFMVCVDDRFFPDWLWDIRKFFSEVEGDMNTPKWVKWEPEVFNEGDWLKHDHRPPSQTACEPDRWPKITEGLVGLYGKLIGNPRYTVGPRTGQWERFRDGAARFSEFFGREMVDTSVGMEFLEEVLLEEFVDKKGMSLHPGTFRSDYLWEDLMPKFLSDVT